MYGKCRQQMKYILEPSRLYIVRVAKLYLKIKFACRFWLLCCAKKPKNNSHRDYAKINIRRTSRLLEIIINDY